MLLLYMCFRVISLLSPAEKLHYHHVVFLKENLIVVVQRRKQVCYSISQQRPFLSGPSIETAHKPVLHSIVALMEYMSVMAYIVVITIFCKCYLTNFQDGGKKSTVCISTLRSRCDRTVQLSHVQVYT